MAKAPFYLKPNLVTSPQTRLRNVQVFRDGGPFNWSAADVEWDRNEDGTFEPRVAMRWNGGPGAANGNPFSRAATWFIVPDTLEAAVKEAAETDPISPED